MLRANALGDFVFSLPALDALRAAYPDAELVLLGAPYTLKMNEHVRVDLVYGMISDRARSGLLLRRRERPGSV